jgi:hypothetical protein
MFEYPHSHENPEMLFGDARFSASDAKLGGWTLDSDILGRINYSQELMPDAPAGWTRRGYYYYLGNPAALEIGNMRVRYIGLPSGTTISVLAMQSGDGFALFTTRNGHQVALGAAGNHTAAELIEGQRKSLFTWALRGVGTLMMYIGFFVFLSPLSNMTSVIPILGTIARGTAAFTAIVIAVPLSMVVIALAWLPYRPILGGGLILLAVAVGYALWRWAKTRSSHVPPPTPAHAS